MKFMQRVMRETDIKADVNHLFNGPSALNIVKVTNMMVK